MAKVISIYQAVSSGDVFLEVDVYPCINNDIHYSSAANAYKGFVDSAAIVDALVWFEESAGIIRCAIPPSLLLVKT